MLISCAAQFDPATLARLGARDAPQVVVTIPIEALRTDAGAAGGVSGRLTRTRRSAPPRRGCSPVTPKSFRRCSAARPRMFLPVLRSACHVGGGHH